LLSISTKILNLREVMFACNQEQWKYAI